MDNTLGRIFKITSFGESHGELIGIVIDGVPAGLKIKTDFIQNELDMRRPAQSPIVSPRDEKDKIKILSGVFKEKSTGAPICIIIENEDVDSSKYEEFKQFLRPSHVDYSILKKYGGFSDYRGSGRFSGRITAGFVIAGAIAKQILSKYKISVLAYANSIGTVLDDKIYNTVNNKDLISLRESSKVRSLDPEKSKSMIQLIEEVKEQKDSIGGTIKCIVTNFPEGKGGPLFNSLESIISRAVFSIPAIKGIEFGAGFKSSGMKGSEHNDPWIFKEGRIQTTKNDSGGIIGGISTGMPIEFIVAVKPTASIGIPQKTVNIETSKNVEIEFTGRHDPCIVPRVIPVVEAMAAIVLLDCLLLEGFIPRIFKNSKG
ncbi:MAG: chorismate synthase [Promethearchaeota archaeon]